MNLKPLHNKVVVERITGENVTEAGIILQKQDIERAKIVAVGPDVTEVVVGEIVLLDWSKATKSGDFFIITVDNIVFVYEE